MSFREFWRAPILIRCQNRWVDTPPKSEAREGHIEEVLSIGERTLRDADRYAGTDTPTNGLGSNLLARR